MDYLQNQPSISVDGKKKASENNAKVTVFMEFSVDDYLGEIECAQQRIPEALVSFAGWYKNEKRDPSKVFPRYSAYDFRSDFWMSGYTVSVFDNLLNACGTLSCLNEEIGQPLFELRKQLLITLWILGNPECLCITCQSIWLMQSSSIYTWCLRVDFLKFLARQKLVAVKIFSPLLTWFMLTLMLLQNGGKIIIYKVASLACFVSYNFFQVTVDDNYFFESGVKKCFRSCF